MTFKTLTDEQYTYLRRFLGSEMQTADIQELPEYDSIIKAIDAGKRLTQDQVNYVYDLLQLKQKRSGIDDGYTIRNTIMVELLNDYTDELFYTI